MSAGSGTGAGAADSTGARDWQGQVLAFEPWNEADIPQFGGHTGAEMASFQKAAYLGLKAGNPRVTACLNVFASTRPSILADFHDNQAGPYLDTFNLHHYAGTDAYPGIYSAFRAVSAGKPLWVTECNVPVPWSGDPRAQEPSDRDLRVQAERVATVYAASLFEGAAATFYFMLPHYAEGQTQSGRHFPADQLSHARDAEAGDLDFLGQVAQREVLVLGHAAFQRAGYHARPGNADVDRGRGLA